MSWKTDWINVWIDKIGGDDEGNFLAFRKTAIFRSNGTTRVRIDETQQSGAIIFETYKNPVSPAEAITELPASAPSPLAVTSYGTAEVYVLVSTDRGQRFLSAPLHTSIEIRGINTLMLIVLAPLPARLKGTRYVYRTNLNGHCVFSAHDGTTYEFTRQEEGLPGGYGGLGLLEVPGSPDGIIDFPLGVDVSDGSQDSN